MNKNVSKAIKENDCILLGNIVIQINNNRTEKFLEKFLLKCCSVIIFKHIKNKMRLKIKNNFQQNKRLFII